MDILDQVFGSLCLILISLLLSLYVGWVWKPKTAIKEIEEGCPWLTKPFAGSISLASVWTVFIKFICPIVITLVLLNALGVDLFGDAAAAEGTPEAAKPE